MTSANVHAVSQCYSTKNESSVAVKKTQGPKKIQQTLDLNIFNISEQQKSKRKRTDCKLQKIQNQKPKRSL